MAEKQDCIFCKIVAGELPCYKVYEDEDFLGFLDIMPFNPGHVLLVPKKHYQWVDEVPEGLGYFDAARKVVKALKEERNAFAVSYLTLGFDVSHAHLQLIPRYKDDGHGGLINWKNVKKVPEEEMRTISEELFKATTK